MKPTADPFGACIENRDLHACLALIQQGVSIDITDEFKRTALQRSIWSQCMPIFQALLQAGANVNTRCNFGWTPLLEAAQSGNALMCQLLIERGAHVNDCADAQWSPLHYAAAGNHAQTYITLLDLGADIDLKNTSGMTPYELALNADSADRIDVINSHRSWVVRRVAIEALKDAQPPVLPAKSPRRPS